VIGGHIVVECVPEELEQFQLNHLKEDVANTNKTFSECAATKKAEILEQLRAREEARRELENLRTRLRFD
jgi:DNA replication protein DnaC